MAAGTTDAARGPLGDESWRSYLQIFDEVAVSHLDNVAVRRSSGGRPPAARTVRPAEAQLAERLAVLDHLKHQVAIVRARGSDEHFAATEEVHLIGGPAVEC